MCPVIDSGIKTSDVRIPLLWIEYEVRAADRNPLVEEYYGLDVDPPQIIKVSFIRMGMVDL